MSTLLSDELTEGLQAGETLSAAVTFDDYPASDGYTCRYDFRGPSVFFVNGVVSTDAFTLALDYATTGQLKPGRYVYVGYVTLTSTDVRTKADSGELLVKLNPALPTYAQTMLAAIECLMQGRATDDQKTIQLGEIQLQHMSPSDLKGWRQYFRNEVQMEQASASQGESGSNNFVYTRFVNPI